MAVSLKSLTARMRQAKPHSPAGFPRDPLQYTFLKLKDLKFFPLLSKNLIRFTAMIESESKSPNRRDEKGRVVKQSSGYFVQVLLKDIEFSKTKKKGFSEGTYKDKKFYFKGPKLTTAPLAVKCTCEDYRFTGEFANNKKKANLFGVRPYTRKTPKPKNKLEQKITLINGEKSYPHKNPRNDLFVCKHIWSLLGHLTKMGFTTGTGGAE